MFLVRKILIEMANYLVGKQFAKKVVKAYCLVLRETIFEENVG